MKVLSTRVSARGSSSLSDNPVHRLSLLGRQELMGNLPRLLTVFLSNIRIEFVITGIIRRSGHQGHNNRVSLVD